MFGAWVGASRTVRRKRCGLTSHRFCFVVSVSVLALAIVVSAGCADDGSAPDRLLDGSEAEAPPVELQDVDGPAVLTKVRLVQPSAQDEEERSASCLDRGRGPERPQGASVERIGVHSETATFEDASGRGIFGCDNSPGPREENRRWCGGAYGLLYDGRLRDPRLDILCGTTDEPVGFVWIHPSPGVRYVSVEQPGYVEVYEAAGELPIRIATISGVEYESFRATFDLFEHEADGSLVRRYRVEAAVAG